MSSPPLFTDPSLFSPSLRLRKVTIYNLTFYTVAHACFEFHSHGFCLGGERMKMRYARTRRREDKKHGMVATKENCPAMSEKSPSS